MSETEADARPKDRLVVIGSGIIGLSSAYYLSRLTDKFEIHVVEQRNEAALGASFQNGGVINVEAISPLNSYMDLVSTARSSLSSTLFGTAADTKISWRALLEPGLATWLWYFRANSGDDQIERNSRKMLKLGSMVSPFFNEAFTHLKLAHQSHNFNPVPGLVLSQVEDPAAVVAAKRKMLDRVYPKQYETEPDAVADIKQRSGLKHLEGFNMACVEPNNLVVHTRLFCSSLKTYLESQGVTFHMNTKIRKMHQGPAGEISAVSLERTDGHEFKLGTRAVVVAAGYESSYLLRDLGITIPLVPIKAYSAHIFNAATASKLQYATFVSGSPSCLITPYRNTTPASVRVTGIRDMDGFEPTMRPDRMELLLERARVFVGTDFDVKADTQLWAGVMPVSPDDFPIVGPVASHSNLYVNTGHGFRGTNWSLVSGAVLAYSVLRNKPGGLSALGVQSLDCSLEQLEDCLLYTSDAADEEDSVDLGGRRIIKKKKKTNEQIE
eukprot:TRINITY_DN44122_c0_g1_i2.p1 TRINITY_DN44122_c0_g1~~TRINITY_DN44122_c0_g1_i2.p1  ORF type:complete len:496 (-),score=81.42 TRINITY_DN44122_c0_g1_i2:50-1537(-)